MEALRGSRALECLKLFASCESRTHGGLAGLVVPRGQIQQQFLEVQMAAKSSSQHFNSTWWGPLDMLEKERTLNAVIGDVLNHFDICNSRVDLFD